MNTLATLCLCTLCFWLFLGMSATLSACMRSSQISRDRRQAGLEDELGNPTQKMLDNMEDFDPTLEYGDPISMYFIGDPDAPQ